MAGLRSDGPAPVSDYLFARSFAALLLFDEELASACGSAAGGRRAASSETLE